MLFNLGSKCSFFSVRVVLKWGLFAIKRVAGIHHGNVSSLQAYQVFFFFKLVVFSLILVNKK